MFPSFTGSSRPRRNVNLSGRTNNPFASASSKVSAAQNTENTIAHAQRERLIRQRERERPPAATNIQRVWRGQKVRRLLKAEWRERWDRQEEISYNDRDTLFDQLTLLVRFASLSSDDDIRRLQHYIGRLVAIQEEQDWDPDWPVTWHSPLLQLGRIIISYLSLCGHGIRWQQLNFPMLLGVLSSLAQTSPHLISLLFRECYLALARVSRLFANHSELSVYSNALLEVALSLLQGSQQLGPPHVQNVYGSFASSMLISRDLVMLVGYESREGRRAIDNIAKRIDFELLTGALSGELQPGLDRRTDVWKSKTDDELLWLLCYYIYFGHQYMVSNNKTKPHSHSDDNADTSQMTIVSTLLSRLAMDIKNRTDASAGMQRGEFNSDQRGRKNIYKPLAPFVREQLERLSSKDNIGNLVSKLDIDSLESSTLASSLASYLLTLVRVFPSKADEIRMWLYQGPSHGGLPAVKFFFKALTTTSVYKSIIQSPQEAVTLLRTDAASMQRNSNTSGRDQQWRVILLFIELYSFVLTIMDDEEFLSGSHFIDETQSRMRQNALPLDQVKSLSMFLKNLCFAMYWNLGDIIGLDKEDPSQGSIAQYFATKPASNIRQESAQQRSATSTPSLAGMPGMTFKHVRGIATALLRRIYERDSRRRFMPKDHWLMTQHFSMDHFITAVVQEEDQKRNWQHEEDHSSDNSEDSDVSESPDETNGVDHLVGVQRVRDVRRFEKLKREQRKRHNRRVLESITPRLEIIQNLPFFVPFETRVQIFRTFVRADQLRRRRFTDPEEWRVGMMQRPPHEVGRHQAKVHRQAIFDDAFDSFYNLGDGLKEPIQITFVDGFDIPEEGIDGGGVTKEFLTSVTKEVFQPGKSDFFVENDQHLLYPNPSILDERRELLRSVGIKPQEDITNILRRYEFLGRIIGKCLYEGVLVDVQFAPFFLLKWSLTGGFNAATHETHYRATINDLRDMDESLYQGLLAVKNYPGDVRDLDLSFELTDKISPSQTITRELRPQGSSIPVTNENRPLYLALIARHRLQNQPRHQTAAFLKGLGAIISPNWLAMFNQPELQTLAGGSHSSIDVADLRRNTTYGGLYAIGDDGLEHPTVRLFWQVLAEDFSEEERAKFLKFATSTPRAPLLGFEALYPKFSVNDSGNDETRLPSTSTCVNLLKLPVYTRRDRLREKLKYSINSGAGFHLS